MSPERFKTEIDRLIQWVRNDALEDAALAVDRVIHETHSTYGRDELFLVAIRTLIKPL